MTGPRATPVIGDELLMIPLELLVPADRNRDLGPREDLEELGRSIAEHGLLQPVLVERIARDRFRLVAGHRRVAAARLMGMPALTARLREGTSTARRAAAAVVENLQRRQLSPLEEAQACLALLEDSRSDTGVAGVAQSLGRSPAWVRDRLALLALPAEAQQMVQDKAMTIREGAELGRQAADQLAAARTARQPEAPRDRTAAVVLREKGPRCPPHFVEGHPLSAAAKLRCDLAGHPTRGRVGYGHGSACGACWEAVIREDAVKTARRPA